MLIKRLIFWIPIVSFITILWFYDYYWWQYFIFSQLINCLQAIFMMFGCYRSFLLSTFKILDSEWVHVWYLAVFLYLLLLLLVLTSFKLSIIEEKNLVHVFVEVMIYKLIKWIKFVYSECFILAENKICMYFIKLI